MIKLQPKTRFLSAVILTLLIVAGLSLRSSAQKQPPAAAVGKSEAARPLEVKISSVGPAEDAMNAWSKSLPAQPALNALLKGASYRYLYTEVTVNSPDQPDSDILRAVYYDYSNQRAIVAEGSLNDPASSVARVEAGWQPTPNEEEFQDAVIVLRTDPALGPKIAIGDFATYRPMPPVEERNADGSPARQRIVNVGLLPRGDQPAAEHEILGVDLASKQIVHYSDRAPNKATALADVCGASGANQGTTSRGTAGQYQMTISASGETLWEMLIIRPSSSSGTRASAIEVRDLKYKGRSVMKRGHVPILNVKYVNDACGPYRDWQYQEGMFQATGTDIAGAPGFRDCGTNIATTELDSGSDSGNFRGVAVYRQGTEVVLVTELEAGWYRYISEWRFDADGTIRPRFGFGAVVNSCTCQVHDHHVYFRLDMDVEGPNNSIFAIPPETRVNAATTRTSAVDLETKMYRNAVAPRSFRIRGVNRSYILTPGVNDGTADTYGRGDLWFLRYKSGASNFLSEIDDGVNSTSSSTEANLDQFVNGESLVNQDSVIWYHATIRHAFSAGSQMCLPEGHQTKSGTNVLSGDFVVGPDLRPDGW